MLNTTIKKKINLILLKGIKKKKKNFIKVEKVCLKAKPLSKFSLFIRIKQKGTFLFRRYLVKNKNTFFLYTPSQKNPKVEVSGDREKKTFKRLGLKRVRSSLRRKKPFLFKKINRAYLRGSGRKQEATQKVGKLRQGKRVKSIGLFRQFNCGLSFTKRLASQFKARFKKLKNMSF